MPTNTVENPVLQASAAGFCPDVEQLITEDGKPVDSIFSEKQQRLLTEPLYSSWAGPGEGRTFVAMSNVGLFFAVRRPPFVPDMLLSLDVEVPADLWPKAHRSYFPWEYGRMPEAVVEVVSNREGGEDSDKLAGYAQIGVCYYVIYDPEDLLGGGTLRGYKLDGRRYRQLAEPIWFPDVNLGLRTWQGRYEDHDNTWLRWVDEEGQLIQSGSERAEAERARAEAEGERADFERQRADFAQAQTQRTQARADQLAEQLRRLGVDPEA